jgi:glyoxylase-like metal-dependent hydrolase (beta-lactamase superfamily II)
LRAVIHHLNCGTMCPHAGPDLVCHVLLIEGPDGLVLVDTGFGTGDVERPGQLGRMFNTLVRPKLDRTETALSQLQARGFQASDVRHVVLTHLDIDHGGGLPDFPQATVHIFAAEHEAMLHPTLKEKGRNYGLHVKHGPKWAIHDVDGDRWHGFDRVQVLPGETELLMIPLPGHTRGHTGVAVRDGDGWLLHAGDAYFHRGEIQTPMHGVPRTIRLFQDLTGVDGKRRKANQERLRELVREHGDEVRVMCAHDAVELERACRSS